MQHYIIHYNYYYYYYMMSRLFTVPAAGSLGERGGVADALLSHQARVVRFAGMREFCVDDLTM